VYALNLERMTRYYEAMFSMRRLAQDSDHVVLQSSDIQLIVHAIPAQYANDVRIQSPPEPREDQALKFFFTVSSLDAARAVATANGGSISDQQWAGLGFRACNAIDPEGNILQVRENVGT
jgi:predicted enzyme related to lactoylglutathione lyase